MESATTKLKQYMFDMGNENIMKLYAVRDKSTGKFVSDITNPRHKFWEKKGSCESAIKSYNPNRINTQRRTNHKKEDLEIVELICIDNNFIIDDIGYLSDWYQNSIDDTRPPVWTDEHLEELLKDFILIPRTDGE